MLQLEKQKGLYEEKALVALQKATQDKIEAVCKVATLQVKRISTSRNMIYGPISYAILSFFGTCDARLPNMSSGVFASFTHEGCIGIVMTHKCVCVPNRKH